VTRCEQQDSLLQGQREMVSSLEADRDEVGPVGPNEVERMSAVNGYTRSMGGMETLGFLVVTRFPSVIVPECVLKCVPEGEYGVSVMACMSACEELKRGRIQTGDRCGEPFAPYRAISGTAPVSGTSRTGPIQHVANGPRVRVFVQGIRCGNAPRGIQQGLADG